MVTKEQMVKAIESLPDDATVDEAIDRLRFISEIEKRIAEADAGKTVPHEEVLRQMDPWLK